MDAKEYITTQLAQGNIEEAKNATYQYVAHYQSDESYITLYILFRIHDCEIAAGVPGILSYSTDVESLLCHYRQIKYYLRRLEFDMDNKDTQEELQYFLEHKVSCYALQQITIFSIVDKKKVYGRLSELFARNGKEKEAAFFVQLFVMEPEAVMDIQTEFSIGKE